jgi:hypothetical protein
MRQDAASRPPVNVSITSARIAQSNSISAFGLNCFSHQSEACVSSDRNLLLPLSPSVHCHPERGRFLPTRDLLFLFCRVLERFFCPRNERVLEAKFGDATANTAPKHGSSSSPRRRTFFSRVLASEIPGRSCVRPGTPISRSGLPSAVGAAQVSPARKRWVPGE